MKEKRIRYNTTGTYETLNNLEKSTKNVWIVLHGMGYLSRFFLKHFKGLPADENYIMAPQAPSKYYLDSEYKHVGASWLTKENTILETKNVLAYLEAIWEAENIPENCNLIVLGFSQGVSIATRWVVHKKLPVHQLVLYAGGIPDELIPADFDFLRRNKTKIKIFIGNKDEYITEKRLKEELKKIRSLFEGQAEVVIFEGGHELKKEIINSLVE
ncbi:alpha/beta hydrolase [Ulvibacterium marinum]|uniref:Esterase n=1 Tax=Ulvibacterium marinum TaxID=2419782 RepID=A0A3B0C7W2_9FLAO|nr:esterase [Ulvibacterium marinum]RKN81460.1 esterase [Ulvibacterium marinum]